MSIKEIVIYIAKGIISYIKSLKGKRGADLENALVPIVVIIMFTLVIVSGLKALFGT